MKKHGDSVGGGKYDLRRQRKPGIIFNKEVLFMGTDKERRDTQKALLHDLRLIFSTGEKDTYTREEIVELLDKIALAKDQE